MTSPLRKIFYWTAHLLGIFLVWIVAWMHLSGIDLHLPFGQALLGLFSRLWLALVLLVILLIAWRWEIIGAALYFFAAGLVVQDIGKTDVIYYVLFVVPEAVTGILFLISGLMKTPKPKEG